MYKITITENIEEEDKPKRMDCVVTDKYLEVIEGMGHCGGFLRYHVDIWDKTKNHKTNPLKVAEFLDTIVNQ